MDDTIQQLAGAEPELIRGETTKNLSRPGAGERGGDTVQQLLSVLPTTLQLDELLRLFGRQISGSVPHSSFTYRHDARDIQLEHGREARYAAVFEIAIGDEDLGRLRFSSGRPFTDPQLAHLRTCLSNLVYPLRNALLYHDAVQASLTDPLTGVSNRSFLKHALSREVALARRHKTPLSLLMIDIDRFKVINDEHGHQAGDDVLRAVADAIDSCLRVTDILARYGGDELVVLLSNTPRPGARIVARHIQAALAQMRCGANDTIVGASASMGIAFLLERDTPRTLLERADTALYAAKNAGGDRIAVATSRSVKIL